MFTFRYERWRSDHWNQPWRDGNIVYIQWIATWALSSVRKKKRKEGRKWASVGFVEPRISRIRIEISRREIGRGGLSGSHPFARAGLGETQRKSGGGVLKVRACILFIEITINWASGACCSMRRGKLVDFSRNQQEQVQEFDKTREERRDRCLPNRYGVIEVKTWRRSCTTTCPVKRLTNWRRLRGRAVAWIKSRELDDVGDDEDEDGDEEEELG